MEYLGGGGRENRSAQRKDDRERKGCMESQNPALGRFCTCSSQVLSQPTLHQKGSNQQKGCLQGFLFLWSLEWKPSFSWDLSHSCIQNKLPQPQCKAVRSPSSARAEQPLLDVTKGTSPQLGKVSPSHLGKSWWLVGFPSEVIYLCLRLYPPRQRPGGREATHNWFFSPRPPHASCLPSFWSIHKHGAAPLGHPSKHGRARAARDPT